MTTAAEHARILGLNPAALGLEDAPAPSKPRRKPKPPVPRPPLADGTTLLCLDVSSTAAGIALMRVRGGRIRDMALDLIKGKAGWDVHRRIDHIADGVAAFAASAGRIDLAVVEWVDGIGWGGAKAKGRNLAPTLIVVAAAQSAVRQAIRPHVGGIETVTVVEWSKRVKSEVRVERVKLAYWQYAAWAGRDKGLDVADAIGIGEWRVGL